MPAYTMELWRLAEIKQHNIGLDDYPIFEEDYRAGLNKKIFEHYYNREIGVESADMFVFNLRKKMNEDMPFYNQLYKSERLKIDPLLTMKIVNLSDAVNEATAEQIATSESASNSTAKSRVVNSQTPQQRLASNSDYATGLTDSDSESGTTGSGTDTGSSSQHTQATAETKSEGFQGSQSELLQAYRDTFMNVDMMVIAGLEELFMQVWDTGDLFDGRRSPWSFGGLL